MCCSDTTLLTKFLFEFFWCKECFDQCTLISVIAATSTAKVQNSVITIFSSNIWNEKETLKNQIKLLGNVCSSKCDANFCLEFSQRCVANDISTKIGQIEKTRRWTNPLFSPKCLTKLVFLIQVVSECWSTCNRLTNRIAILLWIIVQLSWKCIAQLFDCCFNSMIVEAAINCSPWKPISLSKTNCIELFLCVSFTIWVAAIFCRLYFDFKWLFYSRKLFVFE